MVHYHPVRTTAALKPTIPTLPPNIHTQYRNAKQTIQGNPTVGTLIPSSPAHYPIYYYILSGGNHVIVYGRNLATGAIPVFDIYSYHDYSLQMGWIPGSPE